MALENLNMRNTEHMVLKYLNISNIKHMVLRNLKGREGKEYKKSALTFKNKFKFHQHFQHSYDN
jgi:hypothetical protein